MKTKKIWWFLILISYSLAPFVFAQNRQIPIDYTEHPPHIDGRLDDLCWQNKTPLSGFFQFDPHNGRPAAEDTLVWLTYDTQALYFAFFMKDSQPEKIWAELTPRNSYQNNDAISIILDTFNDRRTSITFTVNPRGVQKNSLETIWLSKAHIVEGGWQAEVAIPFKSLRFSAAKDQFWGINFQRFIHRLQETDYFTNVDRTQPFLNQMALLTGLSGIKPSFNLEFFPYLGYRYSYFAEQKDDKLALGLDLKYGILPNLILDITASPDFSDVESDPFVYQLSPYEIQLSENRSFFSESSHYFVPTRNNFRESQFNLFYSRRIQNPKFAGKVTGKLGDYFIGFIGALNSTDNNDQLFTVARLKKDIFKNSEIGFYYTAAGADQQKNQNLAIDYTINFKDIYHVRGQSGFSMNTGNIAGKNGFHIFQFERSPDAGLRFHGYYQRVEENVSVETGYISKKNTQLVDLDMGYGWRFSQGLLKHLHINTSPNFEYDCHGKKVLQTLTIMNEMTFFSNLYLHCYYEWGQSKYQIRQISGSSFAWTDEFLDMDHVQLRLTLNRGGFWESIGLRSAYKGGGVYNQDHTRVDAGHQLEFAASSAIKPLSNIEFYLEGNWSQQQLKASEEVVFSGFTYKTMLHVQFTPEFFLAVSYLGENRDNQYNLDFLAGYYFGAGNIIQLAVKNSAANYDFALQNGWSITLKISYLLRV